MDIVRISLRDDRGHLVCMYAIVCPLSGFLLQ